MTSQQNSWLPRVLVVALAAWLASPGGARAQVASYTLSGRVLDQEGEGLAGAQVVVRGTSFGTLSDATGAYAIVARLAPGEYAVSATFIGRESEARAVTLGAERAVRVPDLVLRETALALGEIVVTGTAAPTARRALGNAVSTVDGEKLSRSPAVTIDQALQGKVAGAVITSNTGTPGGGVSVRLRGTSSIVGGAEPLFIVDGVIVDNNGDQQVNFGYRSNPNNRLADLDPNDIERIEILKGAAAAALFGSRANNGVVQIFTKRGRAGQTRLTASTRLTSSALPKRIDFALTPVNEAGQPVTRFDHQDLIFRDAWSHDSYVALSGGTEASRYYLSTNWVNQNGIMEGSDHEKLNVRLNVDQKVAPWLDLAAGANYIRSATDLVINGEQGFGGLLTAIVFTPTTVDLAARDPATGQLKNLLAGPFPNPLEVLENWHTPQNVSRFVGSFQARSNPFSTLRLEYRLGFDTYEMETAQSIPRGSPSAPLGSAASFNRRNVLLNNDVIGSYDFGVGDAVRLTTSAGMNHTWQKVRQFNLSASDLTPLTELVRGAVQGASEGEVELVTLGFLGQQQVAWRDRLFLTGALRFDASSTFGSAQRWQMYPKLSGSWVVSEQPFFRESRLGGWFSELRLRSALGFAGNQPPLDEAYTRLPRFGTSININRLGLVPLATPGNPDLKPERQREWEAGFDASFFQDRLGVGFTYYDQYTDDLLLSRPFTPSAGFASVLDNIGAMSNKGIELEISSVNVANDRWGWTTRLIYSRNRNRVEEMNVAPFTLGYTNRVQVGQPIGAHFMAAFLRDENGQIATDAVGPRLAPAQLIVGNPWPDFTASLSNDLSLGKNLTATVLLDGSFGHDLWNQTQRIMDIFGAGPTFDRLLRKEITQPQRARHQQIWENYLEDATYVKLRDITVRYGTGAAWVGKLGADRLELEFSGRNLVTWADYSGYDPEVNMFGLSTVARGTDFAVYPNPRTWGLGIRLSY